MAVWISPNSDPDHECCTLVTAALRCYDTGIHTGIGHEASTARAVAGGLVIRRNHSPHLLDARSRAKICARADVRSGDQEVPRRRRNTQAGQPLQARKPTSDELDGRGSEDISRRLRRAHERQPRADGRDTARYARRAACEPSTNRAATPPRPPSPAPPRCQT